MDSLDVKIFRAMETQHYIIPSGMKRYLNLRSMAKHLGVDSDTVRARIKKLKQFHHLLSGLSKPECFWVALYRFRPNVPQSRYEKGNTSKTQINQGGWVD